MKSPYPKCIVCGRKATRWDGGICGSVADDNGKLKSGYVVWLCKTHDPRHKHFDLPDTLPDAIGEIVHLREELQKMHAKTFPATPDVMVPTIRKVTEVYEQDLGGYPHYSRAIAMIAPDPMAGKRARYSVIRINSYTGKVVVIGRELPLGLARKVAKRPMAQGQR